MLLVVANCRDADAAGDFPEQEMVGEASQVHPSAVARLEMETARVVRRPVDERVLVASASFKKL